MTQQIKYYFLLLILLCVSCSKFSFISEESSDNSQESEYLIYKNLGIEDWQNLIYQNDENLALVRMSEDQLSLVFGIIDNNDALMGFNDDGTLSFIKLDDLNINVLYEDCNIKFCYEIDGNSYYKTLTLSTTITSNTKSSTDDTILGIAYNYVVGEISSHLTSLILPSSVIAKINIVTSFIDLVTFLRETDNMNHYELSDYIESMLPSIVNKANEKEEDNNSFAKYIIGILPGDIIKSGTTSATCELQGTLEAEANDGEFNFNYGICYSTNSTPTVNDQTVYSSCVSSDFLSSISLSLPISMTMVDLEPETTYYYRAYFQDNITGEVLYSNEVKEFSLSSESDERTILEQIYYATSGENWTNNHNWCTDAPLNAWYGVSVDSDGRVYYLRLDDNNLIGTVSTVGLSSLEYLYCHNNQLTTLNVGDCDSLNTLYCYNNQLTTLNVSGCCNLEELRCWENKLTSLDLSGCYNLEELYCRSWQTTGYSDTGNQISVLNIKDCEKLSLLNCRGNKLETLDISQNKNLQTLDCGNNNINCLNVNNCSSLQDLYCDDNQLTTLDVSGCNSLDALWCDGNQLATIDVNGLNLSVLGCRSNQLKSLNVSGCGSLSRLYCEGNYLTAIHVSSGLSSITYTSWGDQDYDLYTEPSHRNGWQYPVFY